MAKDNDAVLDIDIIDTINPALKDENYELITTEIAPEIYSFPFLTKEFCDLLITASNSVRELFDNKNENNPDISKHIDYSTNHSHYKTDDISASMNDEANKYVIQSTSHGHYKTDDISASINEDVMNVAGYKDYPPSLMMDQHEGPRIAHPDDVFSDLEFSTPQVEMHFNEYDRLLRVYALPLINEVWTFLNDDELEDEKNFIHNTFIVKYTMEGQLSLDTHNDASDFSIIVKLNDDFEGSGTWFPKQKFLANKQLKVGDAIFFPGLTHRHGARLLESGSRYILNSFCKIQHQNEITDDDQNIGLVVHGSL